MVTQRTKTLDLLTSKQTREGETLYYHQWRWCQSTSQFFPLRTHSTCSSQRADVHYIKLLLWIEKWKTVGFAMKVRKAKLTPFSSSNVWGTHHHATHYHRINSLRLCLRIIGFNLTCILATYYIHYQWVVPELCPTAAKIRIEVTPESINQSNQATSGKPLVVVRNRGFDGGY